MTNSPQEGADDKPPFFKSWSGFYWLLIAVLGLLVFCFHLISQNFA